MYKSGNLKKYALTEKMRRMEVEAYFFAIFSKYDVTIFFCCSGAYSCSVRGIASACFTIDYLRIPQV